DVEEQVRRRVAEMGGIVGSDATHIDADVVVIGTDAHERVRRGVVDKWCVAEAEAEVGEPRHVDCRPGLHAASLMWRPTAPPQPVKARAVSSARRWVGTCALTAVRNGWRGSR